MSSRIWKVPGMEEVEVGTEQQVAESSREHSQVAGGIHSQRANSIKRRRRLQPQETDFLIKVFDQYPRPTAPMRDFLANRLGMTPRGIQIWFQNRRAKVKRDLIESGRAMLLFSPHPQHYMAFQEPPDLFLDLYDSDAEAPERSPADSYTTMSLDSSPEAIRRVDSLAALPTADQLQDILALGPSGSSCLLPADYDFLNL